MTTLDNTISQHVADSSGAWQFLDTSAHWYFLMHTGTDKTVRVRKCGERGAFIVQTDDAGGFHWTGHKLDSGLRAADEYLTQHNRKR